MDAQPKRMIRAGTCLGLLGIFSIFNSVNITAEEGKPAVEEKKSAPVLRQENFRRSLPVKEESLKQAYASLEESVELKKTPGAVCIIGVKGIVSKPRAFGHAQLVTSGSVQLVPLERKMKADMIFDLASLTKQVACNTSVMQLVEAGKIDLDKPVASYMPEFGKKGKDKITPRMLLTHTSGFPAWVNFWKDLKGKEAIWNAICETELANPPMTKRVYSDLGFISLGMLIERVSGQTLDVYTKEHIFDPLGMKDTMYNPPEKLRDRCPATELSPDTNDVKVGVVHDENALAMGGVSGHAGLFSTADDLAIFCQMILNGGSYGDVQILKPETVDLYFTLQTPPELSKIQAMGWLLAGPVASSTGGLGAGSIGHTGFTGTSIWMNREAQAFAILLTNTIHPKREDAERGYFRRRFYQHVTDALDLPQLEPTQALLGTDEQWVKETLASLTPREKAAQILCPWVGKDWDKARSEFAEMQYGGLVFFFDDAAKAAHEMNLMQKEAKIPILVHADMERGLGTYVEGCIDFPGNMALGAGRLDEDAYWMGRITAQEARAVGIQVNFAPVMDVNNNPDNPIIKVRSVGDDPKLVARLGVAFAHGLQESGVIATAKHFPGHGNTATDSHAALAKIESDRKQLRAIELYPFERAVKDGHVRAVMS
ncbi:MAG: serine hydrolase, partial [bacterium]